MVSIHAVFGMLTVFLPVTLILVFLLRFVRMYRLRLLPKPEQFISRILVFPIVTTVLSFFVSHALSWDGKCQSDIGERYPCSFVTHLIKPDFITILFAVPLCVLAILIYFVITSLVYSVWGRSRAMDP